MKTAVDTNVLVDILIDSPRRDLSKQLLRDARKRGILIVAPVVYAELAALLPDSTQLDDFLRAADAVHIEPLDREALRLAGKAWRLYNDRRPHRLVCPQCGTETEVRCAHCNRSLSPRQHILTDFLVGAHALVQAGRLLTHDAGFIRRYFPTLHCLPEEAGGQESE